MKNKWTRSYNKAINFYNDGQINKALEICENIAAHDLSCSEALNLKGLILYQKGNLREAKIVWKLNHDMNNDMMAEKYIEDCKSDEERNKLYKEAEQNLKNMNIDKALLLFKECAKSDFNGIKVNTGIAMCYQRKGDNYRAKEYVDKALSIDNKAVTANVIKKELIELGLYLGDNSNSKNVLKVITTLFIIGALSAGGYSIYKKVNHDNLDKQYSENTIESESDIEEDRQLEHISESEQADNVSEENSDDSHETSKESNNQNTNTHFNKEEISLLLQNKDVDKLYEEIDGISKDSISEENLDLYNKAIDLLKTDGISKFYEHGVWYFNNKNYEDAEKELEKAYKYSEGSYLKEHIIFYQGSTASQMGNNNEAIEYYKKYNSLYPKGSYIEGVLYELALLTNTTDKDMGKLYAEKLVDNYPNSMYINDYIKNILNQ